MVMLMPTVSCPLCLREFILAEPDPEAVGPCSIQHPPGTPYYVEITSMDSRTRVAREHDCLAEIQAVKRTE